MAVPCFCRAFLLPKTKGPFSDLRTALRLLFGRMTRQIQRVVLVVLLTTNTSSLVNTLYHNADGAYNAVVWAGRMPESEAAPWSRYWVLSRPPAATGVKRPSPFREWVGSRSVYEVARVTGQLSIRCGYRKHWPP